MRELQDEKLRRLVRHAYRNVPYYRDADAGAQAPARGHPRPGRPAQAAASYEGPTCAAPVLRHHVARTTTRARCSRSRPAARTGEPFVCYADRAQLEFRWAATLRAQEWTGYRFGDPMRAALAPDARHDASRRSREERADAAFSNRDVHPGLRDDATTSSRRWCARSPSAQPVLIDGYAEALDFLAHYLKSTRRPERSRPRRSCRARRRLPRTSRELIEEAFGCKVFDKYGSREFSRHRLRVRGARRATTSSPRATSSRSCATASPAQPGEIGEVVITDLNNYCMPFIRYRIGDLGRGDGSARRLRVRPRAAAHRQHRGARAVDHSGHGRPVPARRPSSRTISRSSTTRSSASRSSRTSAAR